MNFSVIVPVALILSIAIGLGLIVASLVASSNESRPKRLTWILTSIFLAGVVNSWWLAFFGLVFYKLVILQEDT